MTAPALTVGRRRQRRPSSIRDGGSEADLELDIRMSGMEDDNNGGVGVEILDEEQPTPRRSRLDFPEMATL